MMHTEFWWKVDGNALLVKELNGKRERTERYVGGKVLQWSKLLYMSLEWFSWIIATGSYAKFYWPVFSWDRSLHGGAQTWRPDTELLSPVQAEHIKKKKKSPLIQFGSIMNIL